MTKDELFTLSNFMSFVRIFIAAPIFYYISIRENVIAIGFVVLAMITDWLDGYFARKWNQITTVGKVLDFNMERAHFSPVFLPAISF